jgi:hypothetical protein
LTFILYYNLLCTNERKLFSNLYYINMYEKPIISKFFIKSSGKFYTLIINNIYYIDAKDIFIELIKYMKNILLKFSSLIVMHIVLIYISLLF